MSQRVPYFSADSGLRNPLIWGRNPPFLGVPAMCIRVGVSEVTNRGQAVRASPLWTFDELVAARHI